MKNQLIKIMIIIAVVLIVLALGWICYDKVIANHNDDVVVVDENTKDDGTVTGRLEPGEVLPTNSTVKELANIFTTKNDKYTNYYKYATIEKLSGDLDTDLKLFFTFYALDLDKASKSIKCSDVKVKADGKWKCGFPDPEKTRAFDQNKVIEKYKYLFGNDQKIDVNEAEFGIQKLIYDKDNKVWVLFANGENITSGKYAKTKIDAAYVDSDILTINTIETLDDGKVKSVALEFVFDEDVDHYVFNKRIVE
ncbi:MAG: hypothetical protein IJL76_01695 [Bacilli bacterium]|nr:hypothetical protein [Bacilli bacterium]